jgi:predicted ester cyclase
MGRSRAMNGERRVQVETDGIAIHRVRDGKIVEYWSVVDTARVLQQVGVLPGPAA